MSERSYFLIFIFLSMLAGVPGIAANMPPAPESDSLCRVGTITFSGNRSTKLEILMREVEFMQGDTLGMKDLADRITLSRENLLNTSLFNFVEIDRVLQPGFPPVVDINIKVTERWYLWPFPVVKMVDRNVNAWMQRGDFSRMTYGFFVQKNNFRGKREKVVMSFITGYDRVVGFSYEIPYLTPQQNLGVSISSYFQKNHAVNYDSYNNKPQEVKDPDFFLQTSLVSSLKFSYRKGIHFYHYLSLSHFRYDFSDTLLQLNPNFSFTGDLHPEYLVLGYRFKADFRDYQPFPLQGYYIDIELNKVGLDLLGSTKPNLLTGRASYRTYHELRPRWYYAAGATAKVTLQDEQPYFLMRGLGYDNDFVRGYEYYVVDGQNYLLLRQEAKWELLPKRVAHVKALPDAVGKIHYSLFLSAFTDVAYVRSHRVNNLNHLSGRWLPGWGMGLNVLTYYDKVIRLEFSRNSLGETGFFVHFIAPL